MKHAVGVLLMMAISATSAPAGARRKAPAQPVTSTWEEFGPSGRGRLGRCSVEWASAVGSSRPDADVVMSAWFSRSAATKRACEARELAVMVRRARVGGSIQVFVSAAYSSLVLGSGDLQSELRAAASWLADAFKREIVVLVGDPDKPGDPSAYVLKFKGEMQAQAPAQGPAPQ